MGATYDIQKDPNVICVRKHIIKIQPCIHSEVTTTFEGLIELLLDEYPSDWGRHA